MLLVRRLVSSFLLYFNTHKFHIYLFFHSHLILFLLFVLRWTTVHAHAHVVYSFARCAACFMKTGLFYSFFFILFIFASILFYFIFCTHCSIFNILSFRIVQFPILCGHYDHYRSAIVCLLKIKWTKLHWIACCHCNCEQRSL